MIDDFNKFKCVDNDESLQTFAKPLNAKMKSSSEHVFRAENENQSEIPDQTDDSDSDFYSKT